MDRLIGMLHCKITVLKEDPIKIINGEFMMGIFDEVKLEIPLSTNT